MESRVFVKHERLLWGIHKCIKMKTTVTWTSYFSVLLSIWTIFCGVAVSAEDCVKLSDCAFICSGTTYDISSIGLQGGQPKFKDVVGTADGYLYSYNPCYSFTETDSDDYTHECTDVASCQIIRDSLSSQYYSCGVQSSVIFQKLPGSEISSLVQQDIVYLVATYTPAGGQGRMTYVIFVCDFMENFAALGETDGAPAQYVYKLSTSNACGSSVVVVIGISTGSVLVIVFVVLSLGYLFGGMVYMRVRRGATGSELIPNRSFWATLPGLIKEGVMFITRGCKPGSSNYTKI